MKYCWPFQEAIGNGPQISVWISSKTSELLLAPDLLIFVYFPFTQWTETSKSIKSKEFRLLSDTSLSILCFEIWPNCLYHNVAAVTSQWQWPSPPPVVVRLGSWNPISSELFLRHIGLPYRQSLVGFWPTQRGEQHLVISWSRRHWSKATQGGGTCGSIWCIDVTTTRGKDRGRVIGFNKLWFYVFCGKP